jgi:diguanylate cyclase
VFANRVVRLSPSAPNYFFLMNDKRSSEKPIVPPVEFSEYIGSLLTSCLQGLIKSTSDDDVLAKKLAGLEAEVRKGKRISPSIDLEKEIEEFFDRNLFKHKLLREEKNIVKSMALEIVDTIKSIVPDSTGFESSSAQFLENIESADSIQAILKLKNTFIEEIKKVREGSRALQDELEDQRKTSVILAEKLEQSEAQALVDPLTKVLNRAAYNMRIGQMVQEYKRYKEEWALLTLDIDYFKKFNDEFGHQLGDNVLKSVAGTVKNCIRVSDRVFRYGGEEFVVLLGRINSQIATHLAEKICQAVERSYFVHGDKKLKVTVSIGGAIIATDDNELSIFERADKAMYQAKNNGRNQVVMDL